VVRDRPSSAPWRVFRSKNRRRAHVLDRQNQKGRARIPRRPLPTNNDGALAKSSPSWSSTPATEPQQGAANTRQDNTKRRERSIHFLDPGRKRGATIAVIIAWSAGLPPSVGKQKRTVCQPKNIKTPVAARRNSGRLGGEGLSCYFVSSRRVG
jgi:hypothetical protein